MYVITPNINNIIENYIGFFELKSMKVIPTHEMEQYKFNLNWKLISKLNLPLKYYDKFAHFMYWETIFKLKPEPQLIIIAFNNEINMSYIHKNKIYFRDLYDYMYEELDWDWIIENGDFELNDIKYCPQKINTVCKFIELTEEFVKQHFNKLNWNIISRYQNTILHSFPQYVNWNIAFQYKKFPINIVENHLHNASKTVICRFQELPEDFIEKYKHILDMKTVSQCQKLSYEFIKNNITILFIDELEKNELVSANIYKNQSSYIIIPKIKYNFTISNGYKVLISTIE